MPASCSITHWQQCWGYFEERVHLVPPLLSAARLPCRAHETPLLSHLDDHPDLACSTALDTSGEKSTRAMVQRTRRQASNQCIAAERLTMNMRDGQLCGHRSAVVTSRRPDHPLRARDAVLQCKARTRSGGGLHRGSERGLQKGSAPVGSCSPSQRGCPSAAS